MKALTRATLLALTLAVPAFAEKLVHPSTVAPEYRETAEKRRAEQLKRRECARQADNEKVKARDRTAFLQHCLDADAAK